jgi:multidrug efflux system membrane fusion protein
VTANSDSPLLTIQRMDPIYADFTINENDLPRVRRYLSQGTLKVEVRSPAEPDDPRDGQLTFLDNAVQDGTGTVKMRGTVGNADRKFWPGQFVNVRLVLKVLENAVMVPAQAVQLAQTGPYVYVVQDGKLPELRQVEVGQRQGDQVVIDKGVGAGELVVTEYVINVRPDQPVMIVPSGPATNGAANGTANGAGAGPSTQPAGAGAGPTSQPGAPAGSS